MEIAHPAVRNGIVYLTHLIALGALMMPTPSAQSARTYDVLLNLLDDLLEFECR
jgi:hypothetical protein